MTHAPDIRDPQVWLLARFPSGGYFVEAGAHDGIGDSQTYRLEQAGWSGLCVEPSSSYRGLTLHRRCRTDNRALWIDSAGVDFREVDGNAVELSGIVASFQEDGWDRATRPHVDRHHPSISLTQILHDHGAPRVIEFLSLDTEGSELAILAAHDFAAYLFKVILVEHNGVLEREIGLVNLLATRGYRVVAGSSRDYLLTRR